MENGEWSKWRMENGVNGELGRRISLSKKEFHDFVWAGLAAAPVLLGRRTISFKSLTIINSPFSILHSS
jgi:hypothetical protein